MRTFSKNILCCGAALLLVSSISTQLLAQKDKRKKQEQTASVDHLPQAEFYFTEGEKYFILEDYAKSLLYFQRASELNPTNATIFYKLAEVLAKGNKEEDLQKAAIAIEAALKLDNKNKYFYLLASNIYSGMNQFGKAEQTLIALMKEIPDTQDYLYELAAIYLYDNKPDDALRVYNQAESQLGINEVSSSQKQRIYLNKGKINEAITEGEKLMQAFPDEERYVMSLAEILSQHGQVAKGITYLENFIKEHPDSGTSKMLLAGLYRDSGQEQKSRDYVTDVFDDQSVDVNSKVLMLGTYNALLAQNKSRKVEDTDLEVFVLELFEKLEIERPQDANVHIVGGDLYLTLEKNPEAQQEYLKAIHQGSNSFEARQNLLFLEMQAEQFDSVIVHSEEALEMFPNQAMVYYFNGYAHLRKKEYKAAASSLEQAKKLSTSNPNLVNEINSMLGDSYQGAKEYDKSAKAYDEALAANPNNDIVLNNYSYYLSLRKTDLDKAEKMSTQLVKSHPDNASYLDTHAWVLYTREKYKEAKRVMERAIGTGQATAIHFEHYGDILYQLGDIDGAVAQWQKAKSMDGNNESIDRKIATRKIY